MIVSGTNSTFVVISEIYPTRYMTFYLSKLVFIFLKPLVWILLSFLIAFFIKNRKWKKRLITLGISMSFVFSNPALINLTLRAYEGESQPLNSINETYDYVIVLGGFSNLDRGAGTAFSTNERGNRLWTTLEIYHAGKAEKILVSGGAGDIWQDKESEAVVVRDFLYRMGVDSNDVVIESRSKNTYENAVFTKELLKGTQSNPRCLLVTSAFHMPRARRLFEKQKIDITPYSTDFMNRPLNRPNYIFIPSGKMLWLWDSIIKEWVGMISYKAMGRL